MHQHVNILYKTVLIHGHFDKVDFTRYMHYFGKSIPQKLLQENKFKKRNIT